MCHYFISETGAFKAWGRTPRLGELIAAMDKAGYRECTAEEWAAKRAWQRQAKDRMARQIIKAEFVSNAEEPHHEHRTE